MKNEYNVHIGRIYVKDGFMFKVTNVTMMKPYAKTSDRWVEGVVYKRLYDEESGNITFTVEMGEFVSQFIPASLEIGDKVEMRCMGRSRGIIEVEDIANASDEEFCVTFRNRNEKAKKNIDTKTKRIEVLDGQQATDYYILLPKQTKVFSIDDIIKRLKEYKSILNNAETVSDDFKKIADEVAVIRNLMNV